MEEAWAPLTVLIADRHRLYRTAVEFYDLRGGQSPADPPLNLTALLPHAGVAAPMSHFEVAT